MKKVPDEKSPSAGFTLVEMLVVIAIIAILAAILLPVLARSKLKATQANCLGNLHQLGLAWPMYCGDNLDKLPNLTPNGGNNAGGYWTIDSGGALLSGNLNATACESDVVNCLRTNSLFSNYAPNPAVNHCPGDFRYNNPVGSSATAKGWAYDSYAVTDNASGANPSHGTHYIRLSQIRNVSDCICMVEQSDSRGYNNGTFGVYTPGVTADTFPYWDLFATYHGNVGTFCMADGHVEAHKWMDPIIIKVGLLALQPNATDDNYQSADSGLGVPQVSGTPDSGYLCRHYKCPSNP